MATVLNVEFGDLGPTFSLMLRLELFDLLGGNQVLDLLHLKANGHAKFIQSRHLLGFEVLYLLFSLFKLGLDGTLLRLEFLALIIEALDEVTDLRLVLNKLKSLFAEFFNFFDLVLFR